MKVIEICPSKLWANQIFYSRKFSYIAVDQTFIVSSMKPYIFEIAAPTLLDFLAVAQVCTNTKDHEWYRALGMYSSLDIICTC